VQQIFSGQQSQLPIFLDVDPKNVLRPTVRLAGTRPPARLVGGGKHSRNTPNAEAAPPDSGHIRDGLARLGRASRIALLGQPQPAFPLHPRPRIVGLRISSRPQPDCRNTRECSTRTGNCSRNFLELDPLFEWPLSNSSIVATRLESFRATVSGKICRLNRHTWMTGSEENVLGISAHWPARRQLHRPGPGTERPSDLSAVWLEPTQTLSESGRP